MDGMAVTIGSGVLSEAFKVLTERMLNSAWPGELKSGKEIVEQLNLTHIRTEYLSKCAYKNLKMRTLHSPDADVFLDEVYFPLTISSVNSRNKKSTDFIVSDGFTLPHSGIINLVGIAGQGKSTILRKLFLEEIKAQKRIPIFVELRRITDGDIFAYIRQQLVDFGVNCSSEQLIYLLKTRKVVVMADGFDEVSPQLREEVLDNLKIINNRYRCPIISTSRPDTEICREIGIVNMQVKSLSKADILSILNRLSDNEEYQELKKLIESNTALAETLQTPILVNLLFVCYPYWDSIPETMVDFYRQLFSTLYHKHDKLKNFSRPRKSKVSSIEALNLFSSICFQGIHKSEFDFTETRLLELTGNAFKIANLSLNDSCNFIDDISNITCLIKNDGYDRYVFLHKSIQEFHSALFISTLPSDKKEKFYNHLISSIDADTFDNVILFLKDIDALDYTRMFVLEVFKHIGIDSYLKDPDAYIESTLMDAMSDSSAYYKKMPDGGVLFLEMEWMDYSLPVRKLDKLVGKELNAYVKTNNRLFYHIERLGSLKGLNLDKIRHATVVDYVFVDDEGYDDSTVSFLNIYDLAKEAGFYDDVKEVYRVCLECFYESLYTPAIKSVEGQNNALTDVFSFL
ncbi:NACHT domain-containing protein [Photobacterium kasasachensis]|uniref:NACHT domain-containing protein n=1 Tax=Photobacterium kasasachensis TaxID=2910240 RepID=UPI003D104A99